MSYKKGQSARSLKKQKIMEGKNHSEEKWEEPDDSPHHKHVVESLQRIGCNIEAEQKQREREQTRNNRIERLKRRFEKKRYWLDVLALIGAYCALIFLVGQDWLLWQTLDETKSEQRPWIFVNDHVVFDIVTGKSPTAQITYGNTGKTPAIRIAADFYIEVIKNGSTPRFENVDIHTTSSTGVMVPNAVDGVVIPRKRISREPIAVGDPFTKLIEDDPLTKEEFDSLTSGEAWVATYGIVRYTDTNNKEHWTRFCAWKSFKPGGVFRSRICVAYNAVDQE